MIPINLYSSDELNNIYKDIKKRDFEITKFQTDDEPISTERISPVDAYKLYKKCMRSKKTIKK